MSGERHPKGNLSDRSGYTPQRRLGGFNTAAHPLLDLDIRYHHS